MHWTVTFVFVVSVCRQIQFTIGKGTNDDYLDYDSDEFYGEHASNVPSYIREIRKYRRLGIDYDLHPVPVPVYYPIHVPKPYYKKQSLPSYSDYKPYKYPKSIQDYGDEKEQRDTRPSNETESTDPSKLASRESSYKSLTHNDEYARPFSPRNRVTDHQVHPIPFKDLDPEFTTTTPRTPTSPPKRRRPSTSSPSSPKRKIAISRRPPETIVYSKQKPDYSTTRLPRKHSAVAGENSPRVQYPLKERETSKPPPRRYQHTPADSGSDRTYQPPPSNDRTHKSPPSNDRTYKSPPSNDRTHKSPPSNDRTYKSHPSNDRTHKSPPSNDRTYKSHPSNDRTHESPPSNDRTYKSHPSNDRTHKSPPSNDRTYNSPSSNDRTYKSPASNDRTYKSPPSNDRTYQTPPSTQERSQSYSPTVNYRTSRPRQYKQKSYPERESKPTEYSRPRPSSKQNPPVSRHRYETTSEEPRHQQRDRIASKLGFEKFKGSFSDLIKDDDPFEKEHEEQRKYSTNKPHPKTQAKELDEDRDSSSRSPQRHVTPKVHYDDEEEGETYHPPRQPQNKMYKKYEEHDSPEHSEDNRQQRYKPRKHSSTPPSRPKASYQSSYSSPKGKQNDPPERSHSEQHPHEERVYRDKTTSRPSSYDYEDEDVRNEKLVPRRYVPSKRHYERDDRAEPESSEESSEEIPSTEEPESVAPKTRQRNKRHSTKPRSWQRVIEESRVTTISSSNPSILKVFKAMRVGKSNEDVVLFDTRMTKDKTGQIRHILTKSMPYLLQANRSDIPTCSRDSNFDYCTVDSEYPRGKMIEALQKNSGELRSLLKIRPGSENVQRRFIVQNGNISDGCESITSWITPLRAKDVDGKWRIVANVDEFKQSVNLEICSKHDKPCSSSNNSVCKQETVERHLVTLTETNSLSSERFKFPSYCSCSTVST